MDVEMSKFREITITGLNSSVDVKSSYEAEDLEYLTTIALNILEHIKKMGDV